jgi:uncharacterized protein YecE (DUF72 family)
MMVGTLYAGSMGWSYGFWDLYSGFKQGEYLTEYSKRFNSVEINSSFYRIPTSSTVSDWASQVPQGFIFTAKFPQSISHAPGLRFEKGKLYAFLRSMSQMGSKKGPLLIQLPPTLKVDHMEELRHLLEALPTNNRYAVEFRHRDWFRPETYELLGARGVALVQQAHPWLPEVHEVTSGFVYIRFEGNRKKVRGDEGVMELDRSYDTESWAERIRAFIAEGLDVYAYFSKYYSGYPPHDIVQLTDMVSKGT